MGTTFDIIPMVLSNLTEDMSNSTSGSGMVNSSLLGEALQVAGSLLNASTSTSSSSEDDYGYGYEEADPYAYYDSSGGYEYDSYGGGGKKKEYGEDFYYGAMSVAVLTLGLVIVVEFVLHQIDHSAIGKPFYQAVLDAVYRELAVLGIVEFGVYIMQQYYAYDKDKKAVFADVHFLLFYTDIFNALQAVVQAYATQYYSNRLWVRTEELELDHYVEIREEYDRVHQQLYGVPPTADTHQRPSGFGNTFYNSIFRSTLKAKYKQLLLQVKFHELRVYFLQAYNLPMKLKISDYLLRSELNVMISLVHVSPMAWLWLTALCNLFYYLGGIIAENTRNSNSSATFFSAMFFLGILLFVVIAILVDKHMHQIFNRIMKSKHLWSFSNNDDDNNNQDGKSFEQDERLAEEQRNLFFMGDPKIIVTIIQFMQFGYAIAFSIVIIYWKDMERDDFASPHWYLWSSVICYGLFVWQMARVVPRYTLCTNLGQLVDKNMIRETVAAYKLKEAERFRTQKHDDEDDHRDVLDLGDDAEWTTTASSSDLLLDVAANNAESTKKDTDSDGTQLTTSSISPAVSATDLVSMDTSTVREAAIELRRKNRSRVSRRAKSEGVALMRQMSVMNEVDVDDLAAATATIAEGESSGITPTPTKQPPMPAPQRLRRKKSCSDGVSQMRMNRRKSLSGGVEFMQDREFSMADLVKMDTKQLKMAVSTRQLDLSDVNSSSLGADRRRSLSGGVAAMAPSESSGSNKELADTDRATRRKSTRSQKSNSGSSAILRMRQAEDNSNSPFLTSGEDIAKAVPLTTVLSLDDMSVALSEVDSAHSSDRRVVEGEHNEPVSMNQWLCNFFSGSMFQLTSQVGGTMICFFLVAMRVEGFLQKQCIVPEDDYSWDLPLRWSFVLEGAWLVAALATTALLLFTFVSKEQEWNRNDWNTVVAAMLNLGIVGTCLALLLGAEAQRCCEGGGYEDYESGYYAEGDKGSAMYYDSRFLQDYGYGEEKVCKDATLDCSCEAFGHRVSGGLGGMEPWTALIAFQIFRFILAKKITKLLDLGEEDHTGHDHGHDDHGHGHGHGSGVAGPQAIADAWQAAVAKHPDLVMKYGEFSGEVLQAMLGLEVIERRTKRSSTLALPPVKDVEKKTDGGLARYGDHVALKDERYNTLSPEAQEIIASGMLGRPLKVSTDACGPRKLPSNGSSVAAPVAPLEFEIDAMKDRIEKQQLTTTFEFPNARIIRSIRRCDKIFHPLMKEWTAVDVVLTKHELIYLDVFELDDTVAGLSKANARKQALAATKGGRGLRLCDVADGRRIIGHLSLDDIVAVHVDRELRHQKDSETSSKEVDVDEEAGKKTVPAECWQPGCDDAFDSSNLAGRWDDVTQDRLKIETTHGTIYLRFYADLVDSEIHPERNHEELGDEAPLHKDVAFQWAQTIVHICVDQLKQNLPHFGENNSAELRDYLHMVSC